MRERYKVVPYIESKRNGLLATLQVKIQLRYNKALRKRVANFIIFA